MNIGPAKWIEEVAQLRAQRDALLSALNRLTTDMTQHPEIMDNCSLSIFEDALAAIKLVEGK